MEYQFRGLRFDGPDARPVDFEAAVGLFKDKSVVVWLDFVALDVAATAKLLLETFGFHHLEVEDALSPDERPTLTFHGGELFMVAPAAVPNADDEQFVEVAFFIGKRFVVTVAREECASIEAWHKRFPARKGRYDREPLHIVHALLDDIVDGYFPLLDAFSEAVEDLEDRIFEGKPISMTEAISLKRRLLNLRRNVSPLRDVVNGLLRQGSSDPNSDIYFQDVYDHAMRILETIDMERDILSTVLDAHLSVTSNNLSKVMKSMTIISTLLMTAAFVAGVYGMNFDHMPELHWVGGYGFALFVMAAMCGAELAMFRRLGWF